MARIKRGTVSRRKHNKLRSQTKGYRMTKHRLISVGREALLHAGQYAFAGRKLRKRDMRQLWILRISEAVKLMGFSYSKFMHALKEKHVELDRKILADLVLNRPEIFKKVVSEVMS